MDIGAKVHSPFLNQPYILEGAGIYHVEDHQGSFIMNRLT